MFHLKTYNLQHILIRNYNYNHYMRKRQIIMIIVIISRWHCYLFWRKIKSRGWVAGSRGKSRGWKAACNWILFAVIYYCCSWQYLATTLLGSIWRIIQDKRQEEDKDRRIWNNRISLSLLHSGCQALGR